MSMLGEDSQIQEMLNSVGRNEDSVLNGLASLLELSSYLSELEGFVFNNPQLRLPVTVYNSVRKIGEGVESLTLLFRNYQSNNEEFLLRRQSLASEMQNANRRVEQIWGRETEDKPEDVATDLQVERSGKLIAELEQQIVHLTKQLQRNDAQFEFEIKKYNNKLYEMKETIDRYEDELSRSQDYVRVIDNLECQLTRMSQERYRDEIIIDNMTKKIRMYEKERGGKNAFLSPRTNRLNSPYSVSKSGIVINTNSTYSMQRNLT